MGVSLFFWELNFLFFLLSIFILIDDGRCFAIVFSDEDKEGGERKREGKLEEELGRKKQTNQAKHFSPAKKKKKKKEGKKAPSSSSFICWSKYGFVGG